MSTLLFDIGGTNLRMARGEGDRIENVQKIPTPTNPADAIAALAAYAKETLPEVTGASGGIAGVIEEGVVRVSPNMPEWDGFAFESAFRPCAYL
jgi:predicted NBD/HSP70 family sugar kinase